jgi:hypothetical protein
MQYFDSLGIRDESKKEICTIEDMAESREIIKDDEKFDVPERYS